MNDIALAKILETVGQCFQQQAQQLGQLLALAEAIAKQPTEPAAPVPTDEEQAILDLLEDGSVLTGAQIARLLGDSEDNGTLRNRLSQMVKKGILLNKRPGYALPRGD